MPLQDSLLHETCCVLRSHLWPQLQDCEFTWDQHYQGGPQPVSIQQVIYGGDFTFQSKDSHNMKISLCTWHTTSSTPSVLVNMIISDSRICQRSTAQCLFFSSLYFCNKRRATDGLVSPKWASKTATDQSENMRGIWNTSNKKEERGKNRLTRGTEEKSVQSE